jgi:hypothetical protein
VSNTQWIYISKSKIYKYSIHLQEAIDARWMKMRTSYLEQQLQDLQNSGRSIMGVHNSLP